jgi:hypothetical protein
VAFLSPSRQMWPLENARLLTYPFPFTNNQGSGTDEVVRRRLLSTDSGSVSGTVHGFPGDVSAPSVCVLVISF